MNYKEEYLHLFNRLADIIENLEELEREVDAICMEDSEDGIS